MRGWMLNKLIVLIIIYISQVIMLHILNFYSVNYQLYLNKTGRKKCCVNGNHNGNYHIKESKKSYGRKICLAFSGPV